ncbi:hypothetical protein GcC1_119008 [Golovinomyces cichoracearum]|uniref:Uncharacterized protein n=1 Tax=Golovinomyces cichoracearum TaxID=62708 RepID=A0A420I731_9PEZI|nr:hypothetical protein GcC1_119008 [Golovinomyces cichoracearum]
MYLKMNKKPKPSFPFSYSTMETKSPAHIHETEFIPTRSLVRRVKKHCARYWWIYLLVSSICLLNIILCLIYIIMPSMAQQNIDNSYLLSTDMRLEKPTSHSITLTQTVLLYTKTHFIPVLKPFKASLYIVNNGTYSTVPMSTVRFPRIRALHPVSSSTIENVVLEFKNDASLNEVTKFSTLILTQEVVTMVMIGNGKMQLGALPEINVQYNQSISFRGLNGLQGFNVTDVKVNLKAGVGEPNMSGLAMLYNPSLLTVEMGNVTFALSTVTAGVVGTSLIENMTLRPGNNRFLMKSFVDEKKIAQSMNAVTGMVTLMIKGNSSIYNGQHLPFYENAFALHQLVLSLNIPAVLANV